MLKRKKGQHVLSLLNKLVITLLLVSCNDRVIKNKYIDDNDLVPTEPAWYYMFTLHGLDSDNDGVRDDVELWINEKGKDANVRKALKELSRVYSLFLEHHLVDEEVQSLLFRRHLSYECLSFVLSVSIGHEDYYYDEELRGKMFNTPLREIVMKIAESKIESGAYNTPMSKSYEAGLGCEFKIANVWGIIKKYKQNNPRFELSEKDINKIKDMYEDNPDDYNASEFIGIRKR